MTSRPDSRPEKSKSGVLSLVCATHALSLHLIDEASVTLKDENGTVV